MNEIMVSENAWTPAEGGCPCKGIRYRIERSPLVVHCCHCTWCQKESGSAFGLNLMIESKYVTLTSSAEPVVVLAPSESGEGQKVARCPICQFVVWSIYGDIPDLIRWVRVGTLDDPSVAPPSAQIYTRSKQPWVKLNDDIPSREQYYVREEIWPKASIERREELMKALHA